MLVCMLLSQMEPEANGHETPCSDQWQSNRFASQERQDGSKERGYREIGAGAGGAQVAHANDKQDEAQAIGE